MRTPIIFCLNRSHNFRQFYLPFSRVVFPTSILEFIHDNIFLQWYIPGPTLVICDPRGPAAANDAIMHIPFSR